MNTKQLLADSISIYAKAIKEIKKDGITQTIGDRTFLNPAVIARNEALKQIINLSKLVGASAPETKSELEAIINGE